MEIKIYDGTVFTENDEFEFCLSRLGEWFDFCPCDGISDFKKDKYCLWHVKIVDKGDYFLIVSTPNFDNEGYDSFEDENYKRIYISKFVKKDAWIYANRFNSSACVFKCGEPCLNDDSLFTIGGEEIFASGVVNTEIECNIILSEYI